MCSRTRASHPFGLLFFPSSDEKQRAETTTEADLAATSRQLNSSFWYFPIQPVSFSVFLGSLCLHGPVQGPVGLSPITPSACGCLPPIHKAWRVSYIRCIGVWTVWVLASDSFGCTSRPAPLHFSTMRWAPPRGHQAGASALATNTPSQTAPTTSSGFLLPSSRLPARRVQGPSPCSPSPCRCSPAPSQHLATLPSTSSSVL